MPTKMPRVAVTLKPSTAATLRRMSQLTGNSQSAIIGDLLASSEPVFDRICKVITAAKEAQEGANDRIRESLEGAEKVLEKQLGLMLGGFESRTADLVDSLEGVGRRSVKAARAGRDEPGASRPTRRGNGRTRKGPHLLTGGSGHPIRNVNKRKSSTKSSQSPNRGRP